MRCGEQSVTGNPAAPLVQRAEDAGELRSGTPSGVVAEILVGALIYRLITHEEITDEFVAELVRTIFDGIATPPA